MLCGKILGESGGGDCGGFEGECLGMRRAVGVGAGDDNYYDDK